jgi:uncharacterized protein (TIGR03437 family)
MALAGVRLAPAQTQNVALLSVQSGNGQVACLCTGASLEVFQPITVKATNASGSPVAGATVTWTVNNSGIPTEVGSAAITFGATPGGPTTLTTTTLADGTSTTPISLLLYINQSSTAVPYLVANIQAVSNNSSVIFTETQSLLATNSDASLISANAPTIAIGSQPAQNLAEVNISGGVGTTLITPIQVLVGGQEFASNGVGGVSVRIFNAQTSPTLTCANYGGYADPGSVLSNAQGNALCYPVFNGSGSGSYYVLIGGVPQTDTNINDAIDLQTYGPYNFTSIPGAAAGMQIVSGNNQVGGVGQTLNPLVAEVIDANGNAVQNQAVTWTVTPNGAAAIFSEQTVSGNNGDVAVSVALYSPAIAGCKIVVSLQSNPAISATFQEILTGSVTSLNQVSGNGQSAQTGATFALPLVVQLVGASGAVNNYPVQFTATGPVSFPLGSTVYTGTNGDASITVAAGTTAGTATVTATVGALTQTFTLTVSSGPVVGAPTGMTLVSGNTQSAIINAAFGSPLVVQVNNATGPVSGYAVNFSSSGPVILSSSTATTGSNGQAQITVEAGSTTGSATVTASIAGGYTQVFSLTVLPPGPNLTANSFLNAASQQVGYISPCGLATISAAGLTPAGISALSPAPIFGRLPYSVNGLSVSFAGLPAPIVNVAMGGTNPQVTVQVPCEVNPGTQVPVTVNVGAGNATINTTVKTVSPGIFQTVMSDGVLRAVVVRSDGSFADIGGAVQNPARQNEYVRVYVTGVGPTSPFVDTNNIQDPNADLAGTDATIAGAVQAGIVGGPGLQVISARLAPDLIGVYEIQIAIPGNAPTGNSIQIQVGVVPVNSPAGTAPVSSAIALIPIQP